jgi:nucleoside-diphosphate-sugar epimerase
MKVFVTGASGFIGQAVVRELLTNGHQVLGLARNDASAAILTGLGAEVHRGELADPDSLAEGARACDGVIHLAFIHDFSQYQANAETDQRAAEAMARAMEGTGKPLVVTSGTAVIPPGKTGTENDAPYPAMARSLSEVVLAAADRGVRVSVVRLPPTVHDKGDRGFIPTFIDIARSTGVAAYVGEGSNCWPAVHRLDAARLFRLALEKAAPGSRLHGNSEEGIPMREIAKTIAEGLHVPLKSLTPEEADEHFGWMGRFAGIDNRTSSAITRETLGWQPHEAGLLADMKSGWYF